MSYDNVPLELRQYPQWVVWRYETAAVGEKLTKVPYNPISGQRAASTNSATWSTFEQVCASAPYYNGIGFVLSSNDPYCVIDLDETHDATEIAKQTQLYEMFDSYSEISPSGKGLHIWVKASVAQGRNRRPLEIYSDQRFITVTGNVFRHAAIVERQLLTNELWAQLAPPTPMFSVYDGSNPATMSDDDVCRQAFNAKNGKKFYDLFTGDFLAYYSSQSQADFALIDILAFYTMNAEQVVRIFKQSALGQRDKAQREDYVEAMVKRCYDKLYPTVNLDVITKEIDAMRATLEAERVAALAEPVNVLAMVAENAAIALQEGLEDAPYSLPQGLMGAIAEYIHNSSPRPVMEVALLASIGLMAGITGRAYNISGTGLNVYMFILANTGVGKEGLHKGISKLLHYVTPLVPSASKFIGAGEISSPQALVRHLSSESPSFVSTIGEAGMWLREISGTRVAPAKAGLRRLVLDIYGKSGATDSLNGSIFADKQKNTGNIIAPAVTLIGDSTPESFYGNLDEELIAEGFVPRLTTLEYTGDRPKLNKAHNTVMPAEMLINELANLCRNAHDLNQTNVAVNVQMTVEADAFADEINEYCDAKINNAGSNTIRQLWSRGHLKVLKLAALVAVGKNMYNPTIDMDDMLWARNIVFKDANRLSRRYDAGHMSSGVVQQDTEQQLALFQVIKAYTTMSSTTLTNLGVRASFVEQGLIPYSLLSKKLISQRYFRKDKRGATNALLNAIRGAVMSGAIIEIPKHQCQSIHSYSGVLYSIGDSELILNTIKELQA